MENFYYGDKSGDAQEAQEAQDARDSLLSAAMVLVTSGWWDSWAAVGQAVLASQDVPAEDAKWLAAELALWDAREQMMAIARRQPIIV